MKLPKKIGIESHILPDQAEPGRLAVNFWIDNNASPPGEEFPGGETLDVIVRPVVYDYAQFEQLGRLPPKVICDGQAEAINATASTSASNASLPLPVLPLNNYLVVAKVVPANEKLGPFDPSNCYASRVRFGSPRVVVRFEDLVDIYAGFHNPLVTREIKRMVSAGLVVAEDAGQHFAVTQDANGKLQVCSS